MPRSAQEEACAVTVDDAFTPLDGRYLPPPVSEKAQTMQRYKTGQLVTKFAVGDQPQRMRMGVINREFVRS